MAWTEITDSETGDIVTAEHLNALRDNPIAIADGLDNAPRIKLDAFPSREIIGVNSGSAVSTRRFDFPLNNHFTHLEYPIAAFVFALYRSTTDVRGFFPQSDRLIPLNYESIPTENNYGYHLIMRSLEGLSSANVTMNVMVWYHNRII